MPITIELPPEAERRLTELAARTGRDVDFYLPEIVRRGLEDLEYCHILSVEALQAKYHAEKNEWSASGKDNLRVRVRRSLSWLERAQKEKGDPDSEFIFHWIGFDALCSGQPPRPATKEKIDAFLGDAIGADKNDLIYSRVIASESKTILLLVANAFVFKSFWERYYEGENSPAPHEWSNSLIDSVRRTIANLERKEDGALSALEVLFERLVELRNQLVHGGATWKDGANRDQVGDGARIMSRLLPVFLDLVMNAPDSFNNSDVNSPPPGMDHPRITAEHEDYVRRLSDMADNVPNPAYRDYLREAIRRELGQNETQ